MITTVPNQALTLWPEWAFAIAHLGKDVENRSYPLGDLPTPLCIHAGAYIGGATSQHACEAGLEGLFTHASAAGWGLEHGTERGADGPNVWIAGQHEDGRVLSRMFIRKRAILAIAVFDRVEQIGSRLLPLHTDPWVASDCFAWRARDVLKLAEPVRCKVGQQGLWRIKPSHFQKLQTQIADAAVARTG